MDPKTIELLAGIIFLLIAVVGGGFVIEKLKIPRVPPWARIISGFLGLIFFILYINFKPSLPPPPPDRDREHIIYEDKEPDTNFHNIRFLTLTAKCVHDPPRVNDRVTVEFKLQNAADKPIKILGTYVTAYDPSEQNRDFGFSNKNKLLMPQEVIKTKGSVIVSVPGTWELGPHYALREKWDGEHYPGHWKRFPLPVVQ